MQKRQDIAIKKCRKSNGQLAKLLTEQQPGIWPSNTEVNSKEQVNAINTRSRVELPEIHVKRPCVEKETALSKKIEKKSDGEFEQEKESSLPDYIPPPVKA
ncbi:Uncharacterized protein Adt_18362 [Abeliophyllum distichum]|uniref:Uncharacterized protein n=1 Tax=Abeliophyllum distichum TaxID=126358 RepID=A0ABD1TJ66_9LAMI